MQDIISHALNCIMNAKKAGKKECIVLKTNLLFDILKIMKKNGYIANFKIEKDKFEKVKIEIGKINECKAIKPRFYVTLGEIDKYVRRYLPARGFGILIISTSKGLLTHEEAIEKKIGGSLVAYFF